MVPRTTPEMMDRVRHGRAQSSRRLRVVLAMGLALGALSACSNDDDAGGQAAAGAFGAGGGGGGSSGAEGGTGASVEGGQGMVGGVGAAPGDDAGGQGGDRAGAADGGNSAVDGGGGEGGGKSETVTVEVTPEDGGSVTLGDTEVSVPAGAVSQTVAITLALVDPSSVAPLPSGHHAIGPMVALLPHGLTFATPVSITLGHSGGSGSERAVMRLDDEADQTWQAIASPEFGATTVRFDTSTFSIVVPIELAVPGDVIGLLQFGTSLGTSVQALAFDHHDNLLLAGAGALTEGGDWTFLRKLVPDGLGWSESWAHVVHSEPNPTGQHDNDTITSVCADPDDNVIIGGTTNGVIVVAAPGAALDAYVRKLSPDGSVQWTRQYGGKNNDTVTAVATDSAGNVLLGGTNDFLGNIVIGDAYVRKLDAAGNPLWLHEFTPGSAEHDSGVALDVTSAGDAVVLGWTEGDVAATNAGAQDYFVSKLAAGTGEPLWTVQYGTVQDDCPWALALDPSGDVYIAGQTGTCIDVPYPSLDAFVVKLSGADGAIVWQRDVATTGEDRARALRVDTLGNVVVAGSSTGSFDADSNANQGKSDVFVRKLDPSGTVLWTNLFGNAQDQKALALAIDSAGRVVVGGATQGDLGAPNVGNWDSFIASLKP